MRGDDVVTRVEAVFTEVFGGRVPFSREAVPEPILTSTVSGGAIRPADPRLSPDSSLLAFVDTNERQVHVRAVAGGNSVQVSEADGEQPVWSADSHRLFYATSAGLMAAELQTRPLSVRRRERVAAWPVSATLHDVSPDGRSFLLLAPIDPASRVLVVVNWSSQVRQQLQR